MGERKQNNRHLYQLVAGKSISDIGNYLNMIALNMYVYMLTGSAFYMGVFMAVRLVGSFVVGFYSGILADRLNRKTLMIVADVVRAALLLSLVVTPTDWHIPLLYVVTFTMGAFNSIFGVAFQSSIPAIVGPDNRVRANALFQAWGSLAMVIGMVSGGMLVSLVGYAAIFAIDAATFLISGLNLISLPIKTSETSAGAAPAQKPSFFSELGFMFKYLSTLPILMGLMSIRFIDTFGSAAHNVGMPVFSALLSPENPAFYMGIIWAVWAVGNLVGSQSMSKWFKAKTESGMEQAFGISTFFMSLFFILLFWTDSLILIGISAFLAGISDGVSAICYNLRLQQVPDEKRGRAFGVSTTLQTVGFAVGMVICSPLFDLYTPFEVVGLLHGIPMVAALIFTLYFYNRWRSNSVHKAADM